MPFPTEREAWGLLLIILIAVCTFEVRRGRRQRKIDADIQRRLERLGWEHRK